MEERRKHPRLEAKLKALCKQWQTGDKKAPDPISFSPKTLDLSHGGISIMTDHSLEVGARLNMVLSLGEAGQYMEVSGQVAWTSQEDDMTVSGIGFCDLTHEDEQKIAGLIRFLEQEKG